MLPAFKTDGVVNEKRDQLWLVMTLSGLAFVTAGFMMKIEDHIVATLFVMGYLMAIVGTKTIYLPVLRTWQMTVFGGNLSMVTDSFVIILAYKKLIANGEEILFKALQFLILAMISALSVGAAFYLGEIFALPNYIHHGLDKDLRAGFPMLLSLWPFLGILASATKIMADFLPVAVKKFDPRNTVELVFFVGMLIFTDNVLLCLGIFLLYESNFWGADGPKYVVRNLNEELRHGGFMAFGLIILALGVRMTPMGNWIAESTDLQITFFAMISSPLTGALLKAHDLSQFYANLGYLIAGAIMAPWSSLVGVMVLKPKYWLNYFFWSLPLSGVYLLIHTYLVSIDAYARFAHYIGVTGFISH